MYCGNLEQKKDINGRNLEFHIKPIDYIIIL